MERLRLYFLRIISAFEDVLTHNTSGFLHSRLCPLSPHCIVDSLIDILTNAFVRPAGLQATSDDTGMFIQNIPQEFFATSTKHQCSARQRKITHNMNGITACQRLLYVTSNELFDYRRLDAFSKSQNLQMSCENTLKTALWSAPFELHGTRIGTHRVEKSVLLASMLLPHLQRLNFIKP